MTDGPNSGVFIIVVWMCIVCITSVEWIDVQINNNSGGICSLRASPRGHTRGPGLRRLEAAARRLEATFFVSAAGVGGAKTCRARAQLERALYGRRFKLKWRAIQFLPYVRSSRRCLVATVEPRAGYSVCACPTWPASSQPRVQLLLAVTRCPGPRWAAPPDWHTQKNINHQPDGRTKSERLLDNRK